VLSRADDPVELRPTAAPYTVQRNAEAPALPSETGEHPRRNVMTDLPKRELGRTGLRVSMLGYGAMELRGAPRARPTTDEQAETVLNAVLDAGINYIDTSIDYGVSEERIGRYISHRRTEYYLASKCGCLVGAGTAPVGQISPHVYTRDNIIAGVEQSLVRMKTDYLDLVQFQ
jgi:aryl-alcohol dehydrogenase-like predicted oxidoreductase